MAKNKTQHQKGYGLFEWV